MACARISSPPNRYVRDRRYYRYQRTPFTWKDGRNVKACGTKSDLVVLKQHCVVLSSMLTTSRHCKQRKSMVHSTDWALKFHLAAIFIDSHIEKWLRRCSLCKSDCGGRMQVNEETCISLSNSKFGFTPVLLKILLMQLFCFVWTRYLK